ncbi:hypothetical protein [Methylomagnum ishizawai]|uniref:hypothetical protein n=1 Tax=Methylomagnum ishizawai TaxID=1760988 RepID=UPI001C334BC5|nr:hypothetical protein [Methylomagnum ishizawai]BBL73342.1 hypothetical protein MishRS11D_04400 [Methylomagnum ishizawai]
MVNPFIDKSSLVLAIVAFTIIVVVVSIAWIVTNDGKDRYARIEYVEGSYRWGAEYASASGKSVVKHHDSIDFHDENGIKRGDIVRPRESSSKTMDQWIEEAGIHR